jgi:hypothetical protein
MGSAAGGALWSANRFWRWCSWRWPPCRCRPWPGTAGTEAMAGTGRRVAADSAAATNGSSASSTSTISASSRLSLTPPIPTTDTPTTPTPIRIRSTARRQWRSSHLWSFSRRPMDLDTRGGAYPAAPAAVGSRPHPFTNAPAMVGVPVDHLQVLGPESLEPDRRLTTAASAGARRLAPAVLIAPDGQGHGCGTPRHGIVFPQSAQMNVGIRVSEPGASKILSIARPISDLRHNGCRLSSTNLTRHDEQRNLPRQSTRRNLPTSRRTNSSVV